MTAQWRARSRAWLTANPTCTRCPVKATICDNHAPVRPHDREVLALISDGKGRAAEFQPILDQPQAAWCDPKRLSERQFTAGIFIEHAPGNALAVVGPRENAPEGFLSPTMRSGGVPRNSPWRAVDCRTHRGTGLAGCGNKAMVRQVSVLRNVG